jgi:hypothetical protein
MLEIIILIVCGRKVAEICQRKNRAAWPWVLMMIGLYLCGVIGAAIAAAILSFATDPNAQEPNLLYFVVGYLLGAVAALTLTFIIVNALPDANSEDDDEGYRRPRRRPRRKSPEEFREPEDRGFGRRYGGRGSDEDDDIADYRHSDRSR